MNLAFKHVQKRGGGKIIRRNEELTKVKFYRQETDVKHKHTGNEPMPVVMTV